MSKKDAKSDATGAAEENTSGTDTPAVTSESTTNTTADAAAGGSPDSAVSEGSAIEPAKTDTTRPQQLAGAATNGGAGAEAKPTAARKAKALYRVGACPVLHNHEVYQPGDELELTAAEATRLGGKVTAATAE